MSKTNKYKNRKLKLSVIRAARQGDPDAIDIVLKFYKGYIAKLSTITEYDEYGVSRTYLDETLRSELELHLIYAVMKYKLKRLSFF